MRFDFAVIRTFFDKEVTNGMSILDGGLVGLTNSQLQKLIDLPGANFFSVNREYCYTFFTSAHARTMRELWGVDVVIGMNVLTEVIRNNHDRNKASNCFYWSMSNHEFTVTEAFGMPKTRRLFESHYSPSKDEEGNIDGVTVSMIDVTERFQLGNERRALEQKLVEASHLASLGLMVGCVTHDFNNVLLPVLLNSELALKSLEAHHPAAEFLQEIIDSIRCASELTKQLLSFGGADSVGKEVVDLNEVVEAVSELSRVAVGRRAELIKSLDKTPLRINVNTTQLRQVIVNLLTNASESGRDERLQITIETSSICVTGPIRTQRLFTSSIIRGNYAVLTIHDNGCGMDSDLLERIFQPFFSTKGNGRGLGLSAVQEIVNNHSGFLTIDSTPGTGSSFRIGFPIASQPAEPFRERDPLELVGEIVPFHPLRLLIVNDNSSSLKAISSVCSKLGHSVAIAAIDVVAFAAISTGQFDLVLLDADMAHDCSKRVLNSIPDSVGTPVVLMSTETEDATLIETPRVHSVLIKPFSIEDLASTLRRIRPQAASARNKSLASEASAL